MTWCWGGGLLSEHARAACSRARTLLAQYRDLAKAVAATEDRVAGTMDRIAAQWPEDAGHFRARSQQARKHAALLRQRAGQFGVNQDRIGVHVRLRQP